MARSALAETHGYREFLTVAHSKTPVRFRYSERELLQIKTEIQQHTREYARRQWGWLKKMPSVKPVASVNEALAVLQTLLPRTRR